MVEVFSLCGVLVCLFISAVRLFGRPISRCVVSALYVRNVGIIVRIYKIEGTKSRNRHAACTSRNVDNTIHVCTV
jgi:hypothetical protein